MKLNEVTTTLRATHLALRTVKPRWDWYSHTVHSRSPLSPYRHSFGDFEASHQFYNVGGDYWSPTTAVQHLEMTQIIFDAFLLHGLFPRAITYMAMATIPEYSRFHDKAFFYNPNSQELRVLIPVAVIILVIFSDFIVQPEPLDVRLPPAIYPTLADSFAQALRMTLEQNFSNLETAWLSYSRNVAEQLYLTLVSVFMHYRELLTPSIILLTVPHCVVWLWK